MSTVSHPSFPLHYLIGNPAVEQLELRDINAADLTLGDDGPCPICDAPTVYTPEEEEEMFRLFGQGHAANDSDPDDDPPPAGAIRFDLMADDELIAVCADESADEALVCGASLELLRRLDARPAPRRAA